MKGDTRVASNFSATSASDKFCRCQWIRVVWTGLWHHPVNGNVCGKSQQAVIRAAKSNEIFISCRLQNAGMRSLFHVQQFSLAIWLLSCEFTEDMIIISPRTWCRCLMSALGSMYTEATSNLQQVICDTCCLWKCRASQLKAFAPKLY